MIRRYIPIQHGRGKMAGKFELYQDKAGEFGV
jgi:hypothetical protein